MGVVNYLQYAMIGAILISMVRVVLGPTLVDRMIGLNVVAALVLSLLVLIAVEQRATFYLDVALVYDIFGFIGILAITRYFSRRQEGM